MFSAPILRFEIIITNQNFLSDFFVQRRPNVFDIDATLYKCYTNVLCLLSTKEGALCSLIF